MSLKKESRTDVQFHLAALRGDCDRLRQLLDTGKVHIDSRDRDGTTPLILAAAMGHTDCVRELLAQGADPACCRTTGTSALFFAAQGGFLDIARLLLDAGAAIDAPSSDGGTPLFVACQCGHLPVVDELISRGANVNSCMKDKATPLFIAAQNGHDDVCAALVRGGADLTAARCDRASPLWIAAQCGHHRVARTLLRAGAHVDQLRQVRRAARRVRVGGSCRAGRAPPRRAHAAAGRRARGPAQAGTSRRPPRAGRGVMSRRPGTTASRARCCGPARTWTSSGRYVAPPAACGSGGHVAPAGHHRVARTLLRAGAHVDQLRQVRRAARRVRVGGSCRAGRAPPRRAHAAAGRRARGPAQAGTSRRPPRAGRGVMSRRPGTTASRARCCGPARTWTSSGRYVAPPAACGSGGHVAPAGHHRVARTLLRAGAHVDQLRQDGATPLFKAAHKGHAAVVAELLKYNPELGLLPNGQSALHGAAMFGALSCVRVLAPAADRSLRNAAGHTALQAAAAARRPRVVAYLRALDQRDDTTYSTEQ
ncbi:ankyrin repeat domain-containing protein 29 isoform X2 [Bombyx mandarina]|uniref:Ankyrin repeat domain-containing protein 29 isoform X1 n=1 Tax=Bombyx mandarina TaxID=7092 RepID=A0A6J2K9U9_BOMMA|nr:ankyrin repeat domain-containing protein 29 isoform X1 [Bombyx mandarina]XP_028039066.1 ankyrin repeat domain-containing protein 29 isoform X2 [Bombyx mandarina]